MSKLQTITAALTHGMKAGDWVQVDFGDEKARRARATLLRVVAVTATTMTVTPLGFWRRLLWWWLYVALPTIHYWNPCNGPYEGGDWRGKS